MSQRRSFSRKRTKSVAHFFFKKKRKVSAVRKSWRAQNALFFSALSFFSLQEKLSPNHNFPNIFYSFLDIQKYFEYLLLQLH